MGHNMHIAVIEVLIAIGGLSILYQGVRAL
jgi:hypothetical protein